MAKEYGDVETFQRKIGKQQPVGGESEKEGRKDVIP